MHIQLELEVEMRADDDRMRSVAIPGRIRIQQDAVPALLLRTTHGGQRGVAGRSARVMAGCTRRSRRSRAPAQQVR